MSALRARETLRDAAVLVVAGTMLGLLANALSPRGISLRRDYFSAAAPVKTEATAPPAAMRPLDGLSAERQARLTRRGIGLIGHERAAEYFQDPRFAAGRIVFVDARDEAHFEAGHIRGAYQLDHYRLEKYVAEILGACALAERVVVYCNGGECEDSELAANDLLQFGVPAAKLFVYAGGIAEWQSHRMPIESGARGSGRMLKP